MRKIDLERIITVNELDSLEVATQLFPENKYPQLALNRIKKGEAVLDSDQISKLALMVGVPISALFESGQWRAKSKGEIHKFTNGKYNAELNASTGVTKLFDKGSLFHESVITSKAIPLSDYLKQLDLIITNYE